MGVFTTLEEGSGVLRGTSIGWRWRGKSYFIMTKLIKLCHNKNKISPPSSIYTGTFQNSPMLARLKKEGKSCFITTKRRTYYKHHLYLVPSHLCIKGACNSNWEMEWLFIDVKLSWYMQWYTYGVASVSIMMWIWNNSISNVEYFQNTKIPLFFGK